MGLESGVTAPNDARTFIYENLQLKTEKHDAGPWKDWVVERVPNTKGALGTLRIKNSTSMREFSFGYDAYSRLSSSSSNGVTAIYTPYKETKTNADTGQLGTLTRGALVTTWSYNENGTLSSISNTGAGTANFSYSFPNRDGRQRIKSRIATAGSSWTDLDYDGHDQIQSASVGGRLLAYGFDGRGNRNAQGQNVTNSVNALDQIYGRTLTERGFGVMGSVTPGASVAIYQGSVQLTLPTTNPVTGNFAGWWTLPAGWNGGKAGLASIVVRGTLNGAGAGGGPAVAEEELQFVIPPENETIKADPAGRIEEDAFWYYSWTNSGCLRRLTRKDGTFRKVNHKAEVVDFTYDAEGRRTQKTHTVTFVDDTTLVETSKVLWSGWLPVLEERSRNGQFVDRRWFQWGADLSGTLDGAGGIGGLVAIHEEKADNTSRTIWPVQDGLGNVTAVLDAATGSVVARYDFGPFGEPLGDHGEADVCPFRYQTKWYDKESEYYYFGYRYYSPRLGRWLSRDPLGESGGVNLYAYCGNDPVNRWDYLGMEGKKREDAGDRIERALRKVARAADSFDNAVGRFERWGQRFEKRKSRVEDMIIDGLNADPHFEGGPGELGRQLFLGIGDPIKGFAMGGSLGPDRSLWQSIAAGEYSAYGMDPTRNPRFLGSFVGGELMGQGTLTAFGAPRSQVPKFQMELPKPVVNVPSILSEIEALGGRLGARELAFLDDLSLRYPSAPEMVGAGPVFRVAEAWRHALAPSRAAIPSWCDVRLDEEALY